jgi:hypothetical protein
MDEQLDATTTEVKMAPRQPHALQRYSLSELNRMHRRELVSLLMERRPMANPGDMNTDQVKAAILDWQEHGV